MADDSAGNFNGGYGSAAPKSSTKTTTTRSTNVGPTSGQGSNYSPSSSFSNTGANNSGGGYKSPGTGGDRSSPTNTGPTSGQGSNYSANSGFSNTGANNSSPPSNNNSNRGGGGLGSALSAGLNPQGPTAGSGFSGSLDMGGPVTARNANTFRPQGNQPTPGTGYLRSMDAIAPGTGAPYTTGSLANIRPTKPGWSFDTRMTPKYTLAGGDLPNTPKNAPNPVGNSSTVPQNNLGVGTPPPSAPVVNGVNGSLAYKTPDAPAAPPPNISAGMSFTPGLPAPMPQKPKADPRYKGPVIMDIPKDGIGYSLRTKVAPAIMANVDRSPGAPSVGRSAMAPTTAPQGAAPQAPTGPSVGRSAMAPTMAPQAPTGPLGPTVGRSAIAPTTANPGTFASLPGPVPRGERPSQNMVQPNQTVAKNNLGQYEAPIDGKILSVENYNPPPNVFNPNIDRSMFGTKPPSTSTYAGASFDPTRQIQAIGNGLSGSLAMAQGINPDGSTISNPKQATSIGKATGQPYGFTPAAADTEVAGGFDPPSQEGELTGNAASDNPNQASSQQGIPKTPMGGTVKRTVNGVVNRVPVAGVINTIAGFFNKSIGDIAQKDYDRYANMSPAERAAWSERRASEARAKENRGGDRDYTGTMADNGSSGSTNPPATSATYGPGLTKLLAAQNRRYRPLQGGSFT